MPETSASGAGRLLPNLVRFVRLLRSLGLNVAAAGAVDAARAVRCVGVRDPDDFRLALRTALVSRAEDLQVFDRAFRAFWKAPSESGTKLDVRPMGAETRLADPVVEMESLGAGSDTDPPADRERVEQVRIATYSDREVLREKDFKDLTAEETTRAVRLLRELRWQPAPRRTQRWDRGPGGDPDLRRLLARFARSDAGPTQLPTRSRKAAPRRLVLLCDISGSMERYTRIVLWFACCLAGSLGRVESFVFATRLTRVTAKLRASRTRNPLREIARLVPDWSGGTRIGEALRAFNTQWARRVARPGAVVMVVSDGWDRGDPEALRREVARLQRSCHRLIWLSPLLGAPGYEPLTRGLQAALPHVDDFLPVRNLASLDRLAEHLNGLPAAAPRRV